MAKTPEADALRDLAAGLKRLQCSAGRTARANARTAVWRALARVRDMVEHTYPPIPKKAVTQKKSMSRVAVAARFHKRMRAKGYRCVHATAWRDLYAPRGVPGVCEPKCVGQDFYVPSWAVLARTISEAKLREVVRDLTARKALLAAHQLGGV